jgi:hypothetical protein
MKILNLFQSRSLNLSRIKNLYWEVGVLNYSIAVSYGHELDHAWCIFSVL